MTIARIYRPKWRDVGAADQARARKLYLLNQTIRAAIPRTRDQLQRSPQSDFFKKNDDLTLKTLNNMQTKYKKKIIKVRDIVVELLRSYMTY